MSVWDRDDEERGVTDCITKSVQLGELLFSFRDECEWVNKAKSWFNQSGYRSEDTLCIDQRGRACLYGSHFMAAEADGAYPIDVYVIRDDERLHNMAKARSARYLQERFG